MLGFGLTVNTFYAPTMPSVKRVLVMRVVFKLAGGNAPGTHRFPLGWNDRLRAAGLQQCEVRAVTIRAIRRGRADRDARIGFNSLDLLRKLLSLTGFAGGHMDID